MKLKINGLMNDKDILWKKIACCCVLGNVVKSHPFIMCFHCKYQQAEDSLPRKSFTVNESIIDKNGKDTGKMKVREVKEITIKRGTHNDIVGWYL